MTHVLILSLTFPPDNVSTAHLMGELASDLVSRGQQVTVLTTRPHFNRDATAEEIQPITPFWWKILGKSDLNGAAVYHTPALSRSGGKLNRLTGWMIFHLVSLIAGLLLPRRVDVILAPSPPLTIGLISWMLGLRHRAPYIYNVQELYPDLAISLRVIRSKPLISLLYKFERFVYATAGRVTVISGAMRERILSKGVPDLKVVHIPNWVDTADINVLPKDNDFSRAHGVDAKFVVGYAGNIGMAQSFDEFLDAAAILRDVPAISFMLIGGGVERENIQRRVEDLGLSNMIMLPHQPYHLVPLIYASSDLSYVPLHGDATTHALPSKVYRIMASGRAILAMAERDSGIAELVEESGAGLLVEPGSGQRLADVIQSAASDPGRITALGESGREFVVTNYSRREIVDRYVEEIDALVVSTRA
jgi:colanic acid biosynthesis glycosyl transferase WcaI